MPLTQRASTPRAARARRRNARKSTGPRTPAGKAAVRLNALKHGAFLRTVGATLKAFNESPEEFRRLEADLLESYQPSTAAERMLVEDLIHLRWKKRRNLLAQEGLILQNLERLECVRLRRQLETRNEMPDVASEEVRQVGLVRVKDSPAKFKDVLDLLETVMKAVERGDFDGLESLFDTIYGTDPTMRGLYISNLARKLASLEPRRRAESWPWPPPHVVVRTAMDEFDTPPDALRSEERSLIAELSEEQLLEAMAFYDLRMALLEEERDVVEKYQLYIREHVQITPAMRDTCLAPVNPEEWRLLLRQESMIDRQIDRTTRLLLQTQHHRRVESS